MIYYSLQYFTVPQRFCPESGNSIWNLVFPPEWHWNSLIPLEWHRGTSEARWHPNQASLWPCQIKWGEPHHR